MSDLHDLAAEAAALDLSDPLAGWREEFVIADPDLAYLDGNSLGMPPRRTLAEVERVMATEWAGGLIRSWEHWVGLPGRVGDLLAPLIGARPGEVVVHDSVTVNLYQLVRAALRLRPGRTAVVVSADDFPTDRYVIDGIAREAGLEVRTDPAGPLDDVAVVVRSHVDYRTAEIADMASYTARVRAAGALCIWDLSHSAGVLEVDLAGCGVEMAVGCTYKFLNGGPGAPGFSYVATELHELIETPLQGWFGHRDQFAMGPSLEPHADVRRLLLGTPAILSLTAARVGIETTAAAGITPIAAKARALTSFGMRCVEAAGLDSPTPVDPARRGGHISVRHPDAEALTRRLDTEHGVLADHRRPDLVRLGCSPLTTRFTDIHRALTALTTLTTIATRTPGN